MMSSIHKYFGITQLYRHNNICVWHFGKMYVFTVFICTYGSTHLIVNPGLSIPYLHIYIAIVSISKQIKAKPLHGIKLKEVDKTFN